MQVFEYSVQIFLLLFLHNYERKMVQKIGINSGQKADANIRKHLITMKLI